MKSTAPQHLNKQAINDLAELLKKIDAVDGAWVEDRSTKEGNTVTLDIWENPLAYDAIRFLYDHALFIDFDWTSWGEGRQFLHAENEASYKTIDRIYTIKLLTLAARRDRFTEGSWGSLFESGKAQMLLHRLLELEQLNSDNNDR